MENIAQTILMREYTRHISYIEECKNEVEQLESRLKDAKNGVEYHKSVVRDIRELFNKLGIIIPNEDQLGLPDCAIRIGECN